MDEIINKEPVQRVIKSLEVFDKSLKVQILQETARTAKDAANVLNCEVGAIVKSLLFKTESTFTMCLISGDKKASLNMIKKTLHIKTAFMASPEEVKDITGFTIGGVSPIGHRKKTEILIDISLKRFEHLYAAAGHPNCVFKTNFSDLQKLTKGLTKEIIE